jgi:kinesin family protein 22
MEVFRDAVKPLLGNVIKGLNTTVLAYGNTGAGKTFTMVGTPDAPGIIPNLVKHLFAAFGSAYKSRFAFRVQMSYLEIYNEKVYDLLHPSSADLPIREDQKRNIFIPGLTQSTILRIEDFERQFLIGTRNRSTAATKLNESSSRSHAILQLQVECTNLLDSSMLATKFHLIDLAGSEDNRRTDNVGIRLLESGAINKSLFVLGQVVDALNSGSIRVPYRDSKLTRMLQVPCG